MDEDGLTPMTLGNRHNPMSTRSPHPAPIRSAAARASALVFAALAIGCASTQRVGPGGVRVAHRMEQYWSVGRPIAVDHYSVGSQVMADARRPAVIVLHGSGGMILGGGRSIRRYARDLATRGFETFVVHYFDATGTLVAGGPSERRNFNRWVKTVSDGITYALRQPLVDSTRVAVVGVSLGAYLGVGAAAADPRVTALVDISGGLEPFLADRVTRLPPSLILHGSADKVVPVAEAFLLARYMSMRDMRYEMRIYEGEGHQFADSVEADAVARSSEFIRRASDVVGGGAHLQGAPQPQP